jgi:undecaprenyl pyrophosphate phosphatase UppP
MTHLTYLEAAVVGLVQGVSELFPVSSLGHNVLIPALIGGSWETDLNVSKAESPYLAFIVGLHVATALALLVYFRRDWVRIIGGFLSSIRERRVESADQRLAWMIVLATIPVGLVGLIAEHPFRVLFMRRGLSREDAVRFAFLLSTPVIFAAGVLKIPDLFGPLGQGIGGPILLGSILSFIGAYAAIRFLVRYLRTNTLYPFGIYCLVAGLACVVYLGFVK